MSNSYANSSVGYKRPPVHSQFKPGQSGNPKRGPKARTNMADSIRKAANARVTVTSGGEKVQMSSAEAMLRKLRQDALQGNKAAFNAFMTILEMTGRTNDMPDEEREKRTLHLPRSLTQEEWHLLGAPALEKDRQRFLAAYYSEDSKTPQEDMTSPLAVRAADKLAAAGKHDAALLAYREHIGASVADLSIHHDGMTASCTYKFFTRHWTTGSGC